MTIALVTIGALIVSVLAGWTYKGFPRWDRSIARVLVRSPHRSPRDIPARDHEHGCPLSDCWGGKEYPCDCFEPAEPAHHVRGSSRLDCRADLGGPYWGVRAWWLTGHLRSVGFAPERGAAAILPAVLTTGPQLFAWEVQRQYETIFSFTRINRRRVRASRRDRGRTAGRGPGGEDDEALHVPEHLDQLGSRLLG